MIEPTKTTLYLYNTTAQLSATNAMPHESEVWGGPARIGGDANNVNRTFNGDIDEGAVFNYALHPTQVFALYNGVPSRITIERSGTNLTLRWAKGQLQEANGPGSTGPWTPVSATAPSHTVTPSGAQKFYRVQF